MKVTIHQPEHFPYLGFFQKMKAADLFVILDDAQYTKENFQNRNKFLNKNGVEEWFTVELEQGANKKLIKDVLINDKTKWRSKILSKLQTNFKVDLNEVYKFDKLVDINIASINYCREKLDINVPMILSSTLNINTTKSERLADICRHFGATEYISGGGGRAYLDENVFDCKVTYFHPEVSNYYTTLQHI
jgi:hypothetical protein